MLSAFIDFLDATAFTALNTPVTTAEIFGFVTGALCVWLAARQNPLNFLFGILTTATYCLLFATTRLYGDAVLQLMFLSLNAYGWWRWLRGNAQHHELRISTLTQRHWLLLAATAVVLVPLLQQVLIRIDDSAPFWDAVITTLSLIAQVLLNRKTLENWLLWIVVDVISIPLYISKNLNLTAVLYAVFLLMCINGWISWRRSLRAGAFAATA
jgi:nicotinamide mononucleotide transporter